MSVCERKSMMTTRLSNRNRSSGGSIVTVSPTPSDVVTIEKSSPAVTEATTISPTIDSKLITVEPTPTSNVITIAPKPTDENETSASDISETAWENYRTLKAQFPWLDLEVDRKMAYCVLCVQYGKSGSTFPELKYSEIAEHSWSSGHRESEQLFGAQWSQSSLNPSTDSSSIQSSKHSEIASLLSTPQANSPHLHSQASNSPKPAAKLSGEKTTYVKQRRRFCHHWLQLFPWLIYDEVNFRMFCRVCLKYSSNSNSSFVTGSASFKKCTLKAHDMCEIHRNALVEASKTEPSFADTMKQKVTIEGSTRLLQPVDPNSKLYEDRIIRSSTPTKVNSSYILEAIRSKHQPATKIDSIKVHAPKDLYKDIGIRLTDGSLNYSLPVKRESDDYTYEDKGPLNLVVNKSMKGDKVLLNNNNEGGTIDKMIVQEENNNTISGSMIMLDDEMDSSDKEQDAGSDVMIDWLSQFPWLFYDHRTRQFFCRTCMRNNPNSSSPFVRGYEKRDVSVMQAHGMSREHQEAETGDTGIKDYSTPADLSVKRSAAATAKTQYLVKKFLKFYPWLMYNEQMNVLVCDICLRHNTNDLYIDCSSDLEYRLLHSHMETRRHQRSEEAEIGSWSILWDAAEADGINLLEEESLQNRDNGRSSPDSLRSSSTSPFVSTCVTRSSTPKAKEYGDSCTLNRSSSNNNMALPFGGTYSPSNLLLTSPTASELSLLEKGLGLGMMGADDEMDPIESYIETIPGNRKSSYIPKHRSNIIPAFGKFKPCWLEEFPWLTYDARLNIMRCLYCLKHGKRTTFSRGVRIFSRSCILYHTRTAKHIDALGKEGLPESSNSSERRRRRKPLMTSSTSEMMQIRDEMMDSDEDNVAMERVSGQREGALSGDDADSSLHSNGDAEMEDKDAELDLSKPEENVTLQYPAIGESVVSPEGEKKSPQRERRFLKHWLGLFHWLVYDADQNIMYCKICRKHRPEKDSTFVKGNRTFRITSIQVHASCREHQLAERMELFAMATSQLSPSQTQVSLTNGLAEYGGELSNASIGEGSTPSMSELSSPDSEDLSTGVVKDSVTASPSHAADAASKLSESETPAKSPSITDDPNEESAESASQNDKPSPDTPSDSNPANNSPQSKSTASDCQPGESEVATSNANESVPAPPTSESQSDDHSAMDVDDDH